MQANCEGGIVKALRPLSLRRMGLPTQKHGHPKLQKTVKFTSRCQLISWQAPKNGISNLAKSYMAHDKDYCVLFQGSRCTACTKVSNANLSAVRFPSTRLNTASIITTADIVPWRASIRFTTSIDNSTRTYLHNIGVTLGLVKRYDRVLYVLTVTLANSRT